MRSNPITCSKRRHARHDQRRDIGWEGGGGGGGRRGGEEEGGATTDLVFFDAQVLFFWDERLGEGVGSGLEGRGKLVKWINLEQKN